MITLKDYQNRVLDSLRTFLRRCSQTGNAETAFREVTTDEDAGAPLPYAPVRQGLTIFDLCDGFNQSPFSLAQETSHDPPLDFRSAHLSPGEQTGTTLSVSRFQIRLPARGLNQQQESL